MILGKIIGKTTTKNFKFKIDGKTTKFEYVQVMHPDFGFVLAQITEIERTDFETAHCIVIGYRKNNKILVPGSPLHQDTEVLKAEDSLIKEILNIDETNAAYIGKLENRDIKIHLDLNKLLTKHIAILAKTGAGKSYTAGILIEEILDSKVPLLIIDPHGEYSQLKQKNDNKDDLELLKAEKLEPKEYNKQIAEYGDINIDNEFLQISLNEEFTPSELLHILPAKLSQSQKATLYSIIKDLDPVTLDNLIETLEAEQTVTSVNLISILDYMKSLELFSSDFTPFDELIRPGKCSIINLKGIPPEVQEIIVYKLLKDLFEQRKLGNIAPFFTVVEEVHNFAPERSFGETKSSSIIRTIASEGRKFGLGLCVVTQRPARLDKNVLSQCNTQIILKVTNPNDLKSIISSVENISSENADEIKNLPIGTALVSGVVDLPLLVKIRPRKSKHGGTTVNILEESENMLKDLNTFKKKEILPIVLPKTTQKDLKIMEGKDKISPILIPAFLISVTKGKQKFQLLIERIKGQIVNSIDAKDTLPLPKLKLSNSQQELLNTILELEKFDLTKLSKKSNLGILKLKDYLHFFKENTIITKKDDKFILTKQAKFLKNPEKFEFIDKIKFQQIQYKSKLKPKWNKEEIKSIYKFLDIKEVKECFLVYYKLE